MTMHFPPITEHTFNHEHLMRSWEQDGFLVELYETGHTQFERYGHTSVGYRLYDVDFSRETGNGDPIFEGTDYGIPAGSVIDNLAAVNGIVGFLSCRPGDTDNEYFEGYTERQLTWVSARAEELSWWGMDDIDMETGLVPEDEDE